MNLIKHFWDTYYINVINPVDWNHCLWFYWHDFEGLFDEQWQPQLREHYQLPINHYQWLVCNFQFSAVLLLPECITFFHHSPCPLPRDLGGHLSDLVLEPLKWKMKQAKKKWYPKIALVKKLIQSLRHTVLTAKKDALTLNHYSLTCRGCIEVYKYIC